MQRTTPLCSKLMRLRLRDTYQKPLGRLHCSLVLADLRPIVRGHETDAMSEAYQKSQRSYGGASLLYNAGTRVECTRE